MSGIDEWVNSSLHDVLGYSEPTLAEYLVVLARRAPSAASLLVDLQKNSLPLNDKSRRFAQELFNRVPRATKKESKEKKRRREAEKAQVAALRRNREFTLLDDEDMESVDDMVAKMQKQGSVKKKSKRRKREVAAVDEKYVEDNSRERDRKKSKKKRKETKAERRERERLEDLRERDELAERIRSRDKKKMEEAVKAMSEKLSAEQREVKEEEDRRRGLLDMSYEEQQRFLPQTKTLSRQQYLKKRREQMLELKRLEVLDNETLLADEDLTREEKLELEASKAALAAAEEKTTEYEDEGGFKIAKPVFDPLKGGKVDFAKQREDLLKQRYRGEGHVADPQKELEDRRIQQALGQANKSGDQNNEYDFVFEDQIDFIKEDIMEGYRPEDEVATESETPKEDAKKKKAETMQEIRQSLPVYKEREKFLKMVEENQILVVTAETGAGKTTQLPQYLKEAGYCSDGKIIGCTQPRRVAAMSVASRVADELGTKLGHECGYSIRFEQCYSDKTVIKFMTDGMLLREFLTEPDLASYSVMMIDEAHERTLHTDVLFGLVKDVARFRPDLKLIISSATLDAERFQHFFDDAKRLHIPGRRYEVSMHYTKSPEADYIEASVITCMQIHTTQKAGDVLIFLPGQLEIETCCELLQQRARRVQAKAGELIVCPVYATLPSDQQAKIFEPTPKGARKVVVSTNIAETSLTIDGIVFVIDPGLCKQNSFNPRTGMHSLIVTPVSKASANQRAGRAGRVAPGNCFRLFTKHAYENELEENTIPEIQRTNLGNVILTLKSLGINDLIHFDYMDAPPAETLIRGLEQLYALGALNDLGELTKLGRRMAEFPIDPMLSKTLIKSSEYGCTEEIATICAMLSVSNAVFYLPRGSDKDKKSAITSHKNFQNTRGDHFTLLRVYNEWADSEFSTEWCYANYIQSRSMKRARDVREQLVGLLERVELDLTSDSDEEKLSKSITAGFFYNTAKLDKGGNYKTKHRQTVIIHPSSALKDEVPQWVLYHELVLTKKEYMRCVMQIQPEWLVEIAPHYYKKRDVFDESSRRLPKNRKVRKQEPLARTG